MSVSPFAPVRATMLLGQPWPSESVADNGLFRTYAYRFRLCGLLESAEGTASGPSLQSGLINRPIIRIDVSKISSFGSQHSLDFGLEMKKNNSFDECHGHPPNPAERSETPKNEFEENVSQQ